MRIYSYSPSIEVYAEVSGEGGDKTYYDLSDDVVSCDVARNIDACSTCSISLQNRNHKYNRIFMPMDKITVFATKEQRQQLFTGYITSTNVYTLYQTDFTIKASDTIYQFKNFYWDPQLKKSAQLFSDEFSQSSDWAGYERVIRKLTSTVDSWSDDSVQIGDLPQSIVDWADEIYAGKMTDITQAKDMVNEFYDMLKKSTIILGGTAAGTSSVTGDGSEAASIEKSARLAYLFPNGVPTSEGEMAQYLTTISVPACDTDGNRRNIDLTCHVKLSPLIMAAFTDMASIKFPIQDAYAYCWRYMASGGGNLSYHSYGSCIDVNADANPAVYWGYAPDPSSPYYNNTQVVTIWKSHGFYWGGDWSSSYYDPMHFTYTDN